jgi:hypothetical protein
MKEGTASPVGLRTALLGLCALIVIASAFAEERLFHALLIAGFGLIVILRMICRASRYDAVRYALGSLAFAMLTLTAWKGHREGIAFVFAACSVLVGFISFMKLKFDREDGPPEAEGPPNGSL